MVSAAVAQTPGVPASAPVPEIAEARPYTSALDTAIEAFRAQTRNLTGSGATGLGDAGNRPTARPAWHGRIYENLRNNAFDANPHQIVQRGGDKRQLRRNQYGFSVSGPVVLPTSPACIRATSVVGGSSGRPVCG
jgi:hypothetical protein